MAMISAREYLELLQSKYALETAGSILRTADIANTVAPTPAEAKQIEQYKAQLKGEVDVLSVHARNLLESLPQSANAVLSNIPVGSLPLAGSINAMVSSPYGEPIIVVTTGLISMLHIVTEAFVASLYEGSPPEQTFDDATYTAFRVIAGWLRHDKRLFTELPYKVRSPQRREMIGGINANGLNWVLGHEFAHVLLGHLEGKENQQPAESPVVDVPARFIQRSHEQEFAADKRGFEIALDFSTANHFGNTLPGIAGTAMVLHLLRAIEELDRPSDKPGDHPPAMDRLRAFERWAIPRADAKCLDLLKHMTDFWVPLVLLGQQMLKRLDAGTNPSQSKP
jgi:hypothetical protein